MESTVTNDGPGTANNIEVEPFLSVDGLYWAMGAEKRNADNPQFTDHAFTGEYPTPLLDYSSDRAAKDIQLSLLAEASAK